MTPRATSANRVTAVDIDGVLLHASLTLECLIAALRRKPLLLFLLPFWLLRGPAYAKYQLARHAALDPAALTFDSAALAAARAAAAAGAALELVTAADESVARLVADYVGGVSAVHASTPSVNLSPSARRRLLAREGCDSIPGRPSALDFRRVLTLLRPRQWIKNALVFLPFLLAHDLFSVSRWTAAVLAFVAFSACASISYVFNDILDRYQDRLHPRRRFRPLASGEVSVRSALLLPLPLLAIAAACCSALAWQCSAILAWYLATTFFYSLAAKERPMADVIILALFYTSRILLGSYATGNVVSAWLAAFSVALFLSLAICKRVSELIVWRSLSRNNALGRKYEADDIPILEMMAVVSGFLAVMIMTLYIQSPEILALYRRPHLLAVAVVGLLYWLGRLFIYTHRGKCPDDPLLFALGDRTTLLVLAVAGVFILLAV